jgi:hypothetical protein
MCLSHLADCGWCFNRVRGEHKHGTANLTIYNQIATCTNVGPPMKGISSEQVRDAVAKFNSFKLLTKAVEPFLHGQHEPADKYVTKFAERLLAEHMAGCGTCKSLVARGFGVGNTSHTRARAAEGVLKCMKGDIQHGDVLAFGRERAFGYFAIPYGKLYCITVACRSPVLVGKLYQSC